MKHTEEFYAYLAGFLDADGCLQLVKHKNPKAKKGFHWQTLMSISQCDKDFIETLRKEIGFGMIISQDRGKGYRLDFTGGHIGKLLPHLLPYLRRKLEQAKMLLEAIQLLKHNRPTSKNDSKIERLYQQIRNSHRFGPPRKWD